MKSTDMIQHPEYLNYAAHLATEAIRTRTRLAFVPMPEKTREPIPFLGVQRPRGLNDKALIGFSRGPEWDKRAAEIRKERSCE
jgi:hypothetical protein